MRGKTPALLLFPAKIATNPAKRPARRATRRNSSVPLSYRRAVPVRGTIRPVLAEWRGSISLPWQKRMGAGSSSFRVGGDHFVDLHEMVAL